MCSKAVRAIGVGYRLLAPSRGPPFCSACIQGRAAQAPARAARACQAGQAEARQHTWCGVQAGAGECAAEPGGGKLADRSRRDRYRACRPGACASSATTRAAMSPPYAVAEEDCHDRRRSQAAPVAMAGLCEGARHGARSPPLSCAATTVMLLTTWRPHSDRLLCSLEPGWANFGCGSGHAGLRSGLIAEKLTLKLCFAEAAGRQ